MHCGRFREAADLLAIGLKQIRNAMSEDTTASLDGPCHSSNSPGIVECNNAQSRKDTHAGMVHDSYSTSAIPQPCCTPPLSCKPLGVPSLSDDCMATHDTDDCHHTSPVLHEFVFTCPMLAPPAKNHGNVINFDHLSLMMIYNLALSFDLLAWSKGAGGVKDARLSLSFYQFAYKVQENSNLEIPLAYSCGMLNNMARLNLFLEQKDEAFQCLDVLMSILMYQMTRNQGYGIGLDEQEDNAEEIMYLEQFLNSALIAVGTASKTAVAA
jgi:hypothetical protein